MKKLKNRISPCFLLAYGCKQLPGKRYHSVFYLYV